MQQFYFIPTHIEPMLDTILLSCFSCPALWTDRMHNLFIYVLYLSTFMSIYHKYMVLPCVNLGLKGRQFLKSIRFGWQFLK